MVLVDTSVFIDFFRGKDVPHFKELLLNNEILLSQYVRLELLQGTRKEETRRLEYVLGGLKIILHQEDLFPEAEKLLHKIKGTGWTIGIIDLLLSAESLVLDVPVYSLDKIFKKLEQEKLVRCYKVLSPPW